MVQGSLAKGCCTTCAPCTWDPVFFFLLLAAKNVFRTFGYLSFEMVYTSSFTLYLEGLSHDGSVHKEEINMMNKEIDLFPGTKREFLVLGKIRWKKNSCLFDSLSVKESDVIANKSRLEKLEGPSFSLEGRQGRVGPPPRVAQAQRMCDLYPDFHNQTYPSPKDVSFQFARGQHGGRNEVLTSLDLVLYSFFYVVIKGQKHSKSIAAQHG